MRLRLSDEDVAFRSEMRDFFASSFPQDIRDAVAAHRELSREQMVLSMQIMNEAGIAVPNWPIEWGGTDWTPMQRHIWHEEMQLADVMAPLAFNASMVGPVIAAFGSEELKERFLAKTANLDIWWSQGFSEPGAGSDLASLRTSAVREGDHYVVNGQKTWTTFGQHGDWLFALVRTDPEAKKQAGISFLLIDMASPGLTVRPIELIDGSHEVNEVFLDNVRVPVANLVGEENKGWDYAKFLLGNERVGIAPIGTMKRELLLAKEQATTAGHGGTSLLDDPLIAAAFAELENDLLALELTALRVAAGSSDGKPDPASSVLKLRGSELWQQITELALDVVGPAALASAGAEGSDQPTRLNGAAQRYLNMRKVSILGGSNEVQRQIIAASILGLRG